MAQPLQGLTQPHTMMWPEEATGQKEKQLFMQGLDVHNWAMQLYSPGTLQQQ